MRLLFAAAVLCLLLFLIVLIVNALHLRPAKTAPHAPFGADVDDETALRRFGEILRAETVWPRTGAIDYATFRAFLPLLQSLYPTVFEALETNTVSEYGVLCAGREQTRKRHRWCS